MFDDDDSPELPDSYYFRDKQTEQADEPDAEQVDEQTEESDADMPPPTRKQQLAQLHRIAADPMEVYSIRMDARRLLEIHDIRPHDFAVEFQDFLNYRIAPTGN